MWDGVRDGALVEKVVESINKSGLDFLEQNPDGDYAAWFRARCVAAICAVRENDSADHAATVEAAKQAEREACAKELLGGLTVVGPIKGPDGIRRVCEAGAARIRARGPTDALAASAPEGAS